MARADTTFVRTHGVQELLLSPVPRATPTSMMASMDHLTIAGTAHSQTLLPGNPETTQVADGRQLTVAPTRSLSGVRHPSLGVDPEAYRRSSACVTFRSWEDAGRDAGDVASIDAEVADVTDKRARQGVGLEEGLADAGPPGVQRSAPCLGWTDGWLALSDLARWHPIARQASPRRCRRVPSLGAGGARPLP